MGSVSRTSQHKQGGTGETTSRPKRTRATPGSRSTGHMVSPETLDILGSVSPVGIFRTDTQGRCTYVNQTWCEFSGQRPKEALGFGWLDALHPGDRKRVHRLWEAAIRRGDESWDLEYRLVSATK